MPGDGISKCRSKLGGGFIIRKLSNVHNAAAIKPWWRCLSGNTVRAFGKWMSYTLRQKGMAKIRHLTVEYIMQGGTMNRLPIPREGKLQIQDSSH